MRTIRNPPKWGFPLGAAALVGLGPCRSDSDKLREGKLGVKWADRACFPTRYLTCAPGCVGSVKMFNARTEHFVPERAQHPPVRVKRPDKSANALDAGDIPFAPAQHQPAPMEELRRLRRPFIAVDPAVVDRDPALGNRPPGKPLRTNVAARRLGFHVKGVPVRSIVEPSAACTCHQRSPRSGCTA